jgi:hypothetical protein
MYWEYETVTSVRGQHAGCKNTLANTRKRMDPVSCYTKQSSMEFKNNKCY